MEQPEAVLPFVQIIPDRLFREVPQLPQFAPALQSIPGFFKRCRYTVPIHAGEHRVQHRQQQPQHGGVLCGHLARKVHICVCMEQCVGQRDFLHSAVLCPHPDPPFLQQVKLHRLHPHPPSDRSGRSHGRSAAPARQGVPCGARPAAGPVPRAAAGRASMPQNTSGSRLPARQ